MILVNTMASNGVLMGGMLKKSMCSCEKMKGGISSGGSMTITKELNKMNLNNNVKFQPKKKPIRFL